MISKQNLLSLFRFNGKAAPIGDSDAAIISRVLSARITVGGVDMEVPVLDAQSLYNGDTGSLDILGTVSFRTEQDLSFIQQGLALRNLGTGPIYAHFGHVTSGVTVLNAGRSADGINVAPIGDTIPFTAPTTALGNDSPRDPVVFYYKPTREFICIYTHYGSNAPNYAQTLGVCKTRDLSRWEYVGEIPISWAGAEGAWFVWSGHVLQEDNGDIYFTCSIINNGSTNELEIGWLKFNDPGGDWLDVTAFTPMTTGNPNFAAFVAGSVQNNDMWVNKRNGVYHYIFDSGANGAHDFFHSTSTAIFSGMSTPVSLGIRALVGDDVESPYLVRNPQDNGWILYLSIIFGPINYLRLDESFTPVGTFAPVNIPVSMAWGNGSAIRIDDIDAINAVMSAPEMQRFVALNYVNSDERIYLPSNSVLTTYAKNTTLGNGSKINRVGDTHSNTTLDGLSKTSDLVVGMLVTGSGIPTGTTIASITNSTTVVLSAAATTTVADGTFGFGDVPMWSVFRVGATFSLTWKGPITCSTDLGVTADAGNNAIVKATVTSGGGVPVIAMEKSGILFQAYMPGDSTIVFRTAVGTTFTYLTLQANGTVSVGPAGLVFPTSAAGVVSGAWYDNAGTLTKKP